MSKDINVRVIISKSNNKITVKILGQLLKDSLDGV